MAKATKKRCSKAKATKKPCRICKQTLPLSDFHKNNQSKDGHKSDCKLCCSERDRKGEPVEGRKIDWSALFRDFRSTVDWPGCSYWQELAEHFPHARVLHSVRDPERWYESISNTIYRVLTGPPPPPEPAHLRAHHANVTRLILEQTFHGRLDDRAYAIGIYERHTEAVVNAIPSERLLVFDVKNGWGPLCDFLERPVPDAPFPRVNSTDEFRARFSQASQPADDP